MTAHTLRRLAAVAALSVVAAGGLTTANAADDPYVARGNTHVIIGVTLDEAAVRAVLPAGMEPTEGITGGYNLYRSGGGYNTPAFTRAYVWADVEGHDSATGAKGRWVIWGVTGPDGDSARASGFDFADGGAALAVHGTNVMATAREGDTPIIRAEIQLADGGCAPLSGALNYPVKLPSGKMALHHYPFVTDICGASPVSLDILVGDDHPLAKFKPTSVVWAAQAKNLSYAGITHELE